MMMPVFRDMTSWITTALHRRYKRHLPKIFANFQTDQKTRPRRQQRS